MSPRVSWAIAKHEFRLMRQDLETPLFMLVMPLLMMALLKPLLKVALVNEGFRGANGSEQAVPGMTVMFASFFVGYMGFAFFRDHGWGTWERLRASPATPVEIMTGKLLPPVALAISQLAALFAAGVLFFGLQLPDSLTAFALVSVGLTLSLMTFGIMITAVSRTSQQLNALGSLGAMIFSMLGGAFVPASLLPSWAKLVAPLTPTYWAMEGFRSLFLEGGALSGVLVPSLIMFVFATLFGVIAAIKFRFEETKINWG